MEGSGKLCGPSFLHYPPPVKNELLLASNTLLKEHGCLVFLLWVKKKIKYLYFSEIEGEIFLNIIYRSKERP